MHLCDSDTKFFRKCVERNPQSRSGSITSFGLIKLNNYCCSACDKDLQSPETNSFSVSRDGGQAPFRRAGG